LNITSHDQGIPHQPGTGQNACLIAFFPSYYVFKYEYVKVKVKYSFVLHTGFAGSPPSTLEWSPPT
jgi:hypothetical protein